MKKRDTDWFHIPMFILKSQNFSSITNALSTHPFLAILEGILFGRISSKEMAEPETGRYLHRTNKSFLYTIHNKILMEHYFPARATMTARIPMNIFYRFSIGLSKALITCWSHTQRQIQTIKVVICFHYHQNLITKW